MVRSRKDRIQNSEFRILKGEKIRSYEDEKNLSTSQLLNFIISIVVFLISISFVSVLSAGELEPFKEVPIPAHNLQTPEKIERGKKLFFDRRLSGDGTMSCATCHDPEQAFTDGLDIALSYPTTNIWRNSPTLINVAFQKYLFHDGRTGTLEEQALFPMMSAFEMNQNLDFLEEEIKQVPEYAEAFNKIFNGEPTKERIGMVIASFERTLISGNSPLDRYLNGDKKALSEKARKGLGIFTRKGQKFINLRNTGRLRRTREDI
ncbi:MAG: hypothetical protein HY759_01635 [Nitrospirae bacterium]|nr:hypothetical protein [Nitrospirota bacterium]